MVDGLVISLPAVLVAAGLVALIAGPVGGISDDDQGTGVVVGLLAAVVSLIVVVSVVLATALIYGPLTMRRAGTRNGQTWGKQLFGIRVARVSGEPTTFASAALREAAIKLLLFGVVGGMLASIPTLLDVLWPLWDDQNRALHDMLADTRVVRA